MSEAEIRSFGIVAEDGDGKLVAAYFIIDGGDRFKNTCSEIAILTLIKERFEKEIARVEAIEPTVITDNAFNNIKR